MYADMRMKFLILGGASPKNFRAEKLRFQFRDFATLSQMSSDCNKTSSVRKGRCKLQCLPENCDVTMCTLVHKRRKIGTEFRSTQRAAITLGFATHSSLLMNVMDYQRHQLS